VLLPEFLRARLTYTWLDAIDESTSLRLARRPEEEGRIGLIITPTPKLSIEPSVVMVGDRWNFPNQAGKLAPYARLDMYADYKIDETFSVFARAENLTDARYQEVRDFATAGRSFYGGVRATW
jgi:vitamin B12 transporter